MANNNAKTKITKLKQKKPRVATENQEQYKLVKWLTEHNLAHIHVPSELVRGRNVFHQSKMGVSSGFPDLLIFPSRKWCEKYKLSGIAIELKRVKGSRVSKEQLAWVDKLNDLGWYAFVALGFDAAVSSLALIGVCDV